MGSTFTFTVKCDKVKALTHVRDSFTSEQNESNKESLSSGVYKDSGSRFALSMSESELKSPHELMEILGVPTTIRSGFLCETEEPRK